MLSGKYRPKTFSEFYGNQDVVESIKNILEHIKKTKRPQNILFHGQPGVGKTSLAHLIKNYITTDDSSFLEINASKMKEFNIELLRRISGTRPIRFFGMSTLLFRIVLIDDFEFLGDREQRELGNIMEEFSKFTMYILVTNNMDGIIPQIKSRCISFELKPINSEDMIPRLKFIAENEGIEVSDDAIKLVAETSAGDLRSAIEHLSS